MNLEPIFFNVNPVNFFIISGILQNFVLAGIIFFRKSDRPVANKLMATAMGIVNLHFAYLMVLDTNLDTFFPPMLWIPYSGLTAIGPIIFFYTQTLADAGYRISKREWRHLIPVAVEVVLQGIMIVQAITHDEMFYNTPFYFYFTPLIYLVTTISIVYYLRRSLQIIRNHELWALKNFSNLKEITLRWLQKLIVYYRVLWIVWVPFIAMFLLFFRFQLMYLVVVLALYGLMLILTYLTFWIGLENLAHVDLLSWKPSEEKTENKNFSRLSASEIRECISAITDLMTVGKIYRNENLNLREVASLIKVDPNLVSYVLNNHLHKNFHDFVNQYRIEEVKSRLNDPTYNHLTVLGIGLESGFNSKTTFNRVFRQVTGMTPSEFQRNVR